MVNKNEIARLEDLCERARVARDVDSVKLLKQRIADYKSGVVDIESDKPEKVSTKTVKPYKSAFENSRPGSVQKEIKDIGKLKKLHKQELLNRDETTRNIKEAIREGYDTFGIEFTGVSGFTLPALLQKLFTGIMEQVTSIVDDWPKPSIPEEKTPGIDLAEMNKSELIDYAKTIGVDLDITVKKDDMITIISVAISKQVGVNKSQPEVDEATE